MNNKLKQFKDYIKPLYSRGLTYSISKSNNHVTMHITKSTKALKVDFEEVALNVNAFHVLNDDRITDIGKVFIEYIADCFIDVYENDDVFLHLVIISEI